MRIRARQAFDPWATYDVTAADGSKTGEHPERSAGRLGDRPSWSTRPVVPRPCTSRSLPVAGVPAGGWSASCRSSATSPTGSSIPYHFLFERDGRILRCARAPLGSFSRRCTTSTCPRMPRGRWNRRLVLAAAVGLDALQAR